jgi:diguanylate cyclase (GGDEF)-like protein
LLGSEPSLRPARPLSLGRSLELELAERLDTVLGIAERLAASHDREALFRMIVDETRRALRADATTIRIMRDDHLEVAAWAGLPTDVAADLPDLRRDEGWVGEVLRSGRVLAFPDVRAEPGPGDRAEPGAETFAGDVIAPLIHHDRVIGVLSAMTYEPRDWTSGDIAFITTLATHAAIALTNAELFEQTEARAAQLAVVQAASARLSRAGTVEGVGRTVVEETRRIIDYHNARVYLLEAPDDVVPIAFAGTVGAYEQVDFSLLRTKLGEGFTGWVALHGEPLLINDANLDPRGQNIPGTDDVDESMLVVPMRYDQAIVGVITLSKLGIGQFDADDLRLLAILADQAATAVESARLLARTQDLAGELRRLLDMSAELSESLDPRQVANLMAGHLAKAMGVDECAISYWDRATGRVDSLGYYPLTKVEEMDPWYDVSEFPETLRVLERQEAVIVDADDPDADPAEVRLLLQEGNKVLAMLPLVVKGQSIGLVELFARTSISFDAERLALGRTMANEAAMALENARLYEDARNLADRDPLTGFFNHRFLHERLGEEIVRAQRGRRPVSLLMLDLDDFKLVNDTFGHLFGDRVLTWAAELIRSTLRTSDVPARYGGDEFAIILPDTDADDARVAADRILDAFRDRPFVGEQRGPVPIAASIGVATFPTTGRNATDLIAAADHALYEVKRGGGHDAAVAPEAAA